MVGCIRGKEVKILPSGAGYYIGTSDEKTGPYCRISQYYTTEAEPTRRLRSLKFEVRNSIENIQCNCGLGCGLRVLL